ncbi:hypothetical protein HOC35_01970 [Candidatus Woesearchaeota archaeon]|nr:hypothetical protein [Candidatus Woesearchaeota archaeon]
MSKSMNQGAEHWFLGYISEHITDQDRRQALEEKTLEAIANSQTHFFASVKVLLEKSSNRDPYEAIKEWELYNEVISPSWMKKDKKEALGSCNLCGSNLSRRIVAFRNTKNGQFMSTGSECKTHLNETFEFFDYKIGSDEKRKKEIKEERQGQLEDFANDPVKAINNAINKPKTKADKELANMLQHLYDKLRPHFDLLEAVTIASPDAFSEKKFTPYFITPEKNGNFLGWFGQQGKDNLPDFLWDIYRRSKKEFTFVSQSEWAAMYMYSALHRKESKSVFIGSIEDDLRLLESLDPKNPIIKKYGPVNLDSVRYILDGEDTEVTLLEVRKVFDIRPNILEIRKDINREQANYYDDNVLDVMSTLEKIFMNEKGLWREEFATGTTIYSKTLNRDDYKLIKDLLKRGKLGVGTFSENIFASYSMNEFREVTENLEIMKRKLSYQSSILKEQGVEIEDVYDVTPELLSQLNAHDFLRGNRYKLADNFSLEEVKTDDSDITKILSLKEVIEKIEKSDVSPKHKLFHRMKKDHLERIKKVEEHGLYHQDDVKRLTRMYNTVANYEECVGDTSQAKGLITKLSEEYSFLIREIKQLPDLAKDYFETDTIAVIKTVSDALLKIPVFVKDAENKIREKGVERSTREMLSKLEELRDEFTLYTTASFSTRDKQFFIFTGNVGLDSCVKRVNEFVKLYDPEKIEETYSRIREGYLTLEKALVRSPEFLQNMSRIIEKEGLFKTYHNGWFTDDGSKRLYETLVGDNSERENTLVSRVLIDKVTSINKLLSRIERIEAGIPEDEILMAISEDTHAEYNHNLTSRRYNIKIVGEETFQHKGFIKNQLDMRFNREHGWHSDNPINGNKLRLYALELHEYNTINSSNLRMSISQG